MKIDFKFVRISRVFRGADDVNWWIFVEIPYER